ncbi:MAG: hypothetical protein AB7K41_13600 [Bdellovibrionales bacterium]
MGSNFEMRILRPEDGEAILAFARARLEAQIEDAMEREFAQWSAPWRGEALQHYLASGWSFAAVDANGQILGFALAQPLLFFRGFTQTVWTEYADASSEIVGAALVETLYRWSRDKHIQKLIFADSEQVPGWAKALGGQRTAEGWWEMATTRIKL